MQTIREHLESRFMSIDIHRPYIDEENQLAYFWIYNVTGQLVGYQRYNPTGDKNYKTGNPKYHTYGALNTLRVWGLETVKKDDSVIFATEGIFDVCRLTRHGLSGIATMTNSPTSDFLNWKYMMNRKFVLISDNDVAGKLLQKCFSYVEVVPNGYKDLGECPEEYVTYLRSKYGH